MVAIVELFLIVSILSNGTDVIIQLKPKTIKAIEINLLTQNIPITKKIVLKP